MELLLKRTTFTEESTIGELYVDGKFECYILEDKDRGLKSSMSLKEIQEKKVYAKTAIPTGKYLVANTHSPRFEKYLPLLLNVPGYAGIRIHPGNYAKDTEGCLLPGVTKGKDFVGSSRIAFNNLFKKIRAAEKKEKINLTIV
jgi:4-hydroxy-3-methylbut-2-en-1-yl diphosphate synthase IspG/GcpE